MTAGLSEMVTYEEVIYFNILFSYLFGSPEQNDERRSGRQHCYRHLNSELPRFDNRHENSGSQLRD